MSELVNPQQLFAPEDSTLKAVVLEILHRPEIQAIGLKEIARELADRYDSTEVERCLLTLSEQGLVELAYSSGYGVDFRVRRQYSLSVPPSSLNFRAPGLA